MTTTTTAPRTTERADLGTRRGVPAGAAVVAGVLAVAVSAIHVLDQGGLTALKDPAYLGWGYRLLEVGGVVTAAWLASRRDQVLAWVLALGVALGPIVGYSLTRSVGLPQATDDIGNWFEPLGVAAMSTEAVLLVVSLAMLRRAARR